MMKSPHLAPQDGRPVGGALSEALDSLAAGFELLRLGLYWFWLHLVLGALVLTKLVLIALYGHPSRRQR